MKIKIVALLLLLNSWFLARAQEIPVNSEQQIENLTEQEDGETEDDSFLQAMQQFKKHPINLNDADDTELKELRILTDLQIINLISYRKVLGRLISIYELQSIPGWDINTIKRILDYVEIGRVLLVKDDFQKRFTKGSHNLLFRIAESWKKEYLDSSGSLHFLGSPQRIFFRYRYSYKNLLQFGVTGDKDAGEQFFKGAQRAGFDFYSIHLFIRNSGSIKALALGDFTANFGQGLILWQSQAFKKSAETMGIKRQSATLRPYNSAGEFLFNRGAGITINRHHFEFTGFISRRKLGSNIASYMDEPKYITSFQTSGYHRNVLEVEDRNNVVQFSSGMNVGYGRNGRHIGMNAVYYMFSLPIQKRDEPYNRYSIAGNRWYNLSLDYSYTWKNIHFFGETAIDRKSNIASINGMLVSADKKIDLSFVVRSISKAYQALNGNAFTENSVPTNEQGVYTGLSFRPTGTIRVDAYADIFGFPWPKYKSDAPGYGKDFLVQLNYAPNKQTEIYTRFKSETKTINRNDGTVLDQLFSVPKQNWRTQVNIKLSKSFSLRNRIEVLWYDSKSNSTEQGFLFFIDGVYKPGLKPFSFIVRMGYFDTDGYNSRIYAYENDVLFSYSIPAFFGKGLRYYLTANYNFGKTISCWVRFGKTFSQVQVLGSGASVEGNISRGTDIKMELIVGF